MTDFLGLNPEDEVVSIEVIEHEAPATDRTVARRIALQALYELDCTRHQIETVLEARLKAQEVDGRGARYARALVTGVRQHREQLDQAIRRYATEWPLDQIAIIDRNILRIAVYEFAGTQSIPTGVAIDEAVNLARLFGADHSTGFVNGVLGKMSTEEADVRKALAVEGETGL